MIGLMQGPSSDMHTSLMQRTNLHNLRSHQKLHTRRELEAILADVERSEAANLPRKHRCCGGVRRGWKCGQ
jgi:hypothetical protein